MAVYSIKIGEIHLTADKPITEDERTRAIAALNADTYICASPDGLDVVGKINVESVRLNRRRP